MVKNRRHPARAEVSDGSSSSSNATNLKCAPFADVGGIFAAFARKRAAIAPDFMKAYALWKRETRGSFVAFVHELDPSLPVAGKAYQKHPSYHAALYLRQLVENPEARQRRLTPLAFAAVTIKSVLPLCGSRDEQEETLEALLSATKWRERERRRFLTAVRRAKPIGLSKSHILRERHRGLEDQSGPTTRRGERLRSRRRDGRQQQPGVTR